MNRFKALSIISATIAALLVVPSSPASATTCISPVANTNPAGTTTISAHPLPNMGTTNGDVLNSVVIAAFGRTLLVVGGNFSIARDPDGTPHAATHMAMFDVVTGKVYWGASGINSYVRALAVAPGRIYFGGDFTAPRNHIASYTVTGVAGGKPILNSYETGSPRRVRVIKVRSSDGVVFFGGDENVLRITNSVGKLIKYHQADSSIRALLLSRDGGTSIFVGGLFDHIDGLARHGLVRLYPASSGGIYAPFHPVLRSNFPGHPASGDLVLSLGWDRFTHILTGTGGTTKNYIISFNPNNGIKYLIASSEGDVQGIIAVGNSIVAGWHRNHGNSTGCPWYHFGGQLTGTGTILTEWDPKLSGGAGNADGGNGGLQAMSIVGNRLFLVGNFTRAESTCGTTDANYNVCTLGIQKQSVVEFTIS